MANETKSHSAPPTLVALLETAMGHLGTALVQQVESDDKIIMDHVKAAHELIKGALAQERSEKQPKLRAALLQIVERAPRTKPEPPIDDWGHYRGSGNEGDIADHVRDWERWEAAEIAGGALFDTRPTA